MTVGKIYETDRSPTDLGERFEIDENGSSQWHQ